jgi:hypothetical protein
LVRSIGHNVRDVNPPSFKRFLALGEKLVALIYGRYS